MKLNFYLTLQRASVCKDLKVPYAAPASKFARCRKTILTRDNVKTSKMKWTSLIQNELKFKLFRNELKLHIVQKSGKVLFTASMG